MSEGKRKSFNEKILFHQITFEFAFEFTYWNALVVTKFI
jgi:hypothetical protein